MDYDTKRAPTGASVGRSSLRVCAKSVVFTQQMARSMRCCSDPTLTARTGIARCTPLLSVCIGPDCRVASLRPRATTTISQPVSASAVEIALPMAPAPITAIRISQPCEIAVCFTISSAMSMIMSSCPPTILRRPASVRIARVSTPWSLAAFSAWRRKLE